MLWNPRQTAFPPHHPRAKPLGTTVKRRGSGFVTAIGRVRHGLAWDQRAPIGARGPSAATARDRRRATRRSSA